MMTRVIKFAAWDPHRKRMLSSEELVRNKIALNPSAGEFVNMDYLELPHLIPLEFFGRMDKNGKEIFEEDIILSPMIKRDPNKQVRKGIIKHIFTGAGSTLAFTIDNETAAWVIEESVIIGNSYANPERLKNDYI